jgi:hypothetical protein
MAIEEVHAGGGFITDQPPTHKDSKRDQALTTDFTDATDMGGINFSRSDAVEVKPLDPSG